MVVIEQFNFPHFDESEFSQCPCVLTHSELLDVLLTFCVQNGVPEQISFECPMETHVILPFYWCANPSKTAWPAEH